jgi:hypothetical protein
MRIAVAAETGTRVKTHVSGEMGIGVELTDLEQQFPFFQLPQTVLPLAFPHMPSVVFVGSKPL